jgi:hypothetical protein
MLTKKQIKANDKANDKRIEKAYGVVGNGVQIDLFTGIPAVFKVGRESIAAGDDDEALKAKLAAFLQTIRRN